MATDMIDSASHEAEKGPRAEDMTTIRKLVRKIDFRVLPWITITYALSLIDRTNIGTAKIAGMEKDLNLLGDRYNIALLIFFPAYIITEIPSNSIIRRIGTRKYLTFMIAGWGAIAMCFGFLQNYDQLVGMRFLLGLFEGGFAPACIYLISSWYKRYEVHQRLAIWYVTGYVISGFTGVISYGLSLMEGAGGLRGWRWIFIMPGLITIVAALPIYFFVAEFPERARWLRQDELKMIQDRLEEDRGENFEDKANWKAFLSAATDWKVYVISAMLMLPNAGAYSMAFFSPSILASFGYSTALSQILSTPPTIFAVIMSITTGIVADRLHMRSPFIVGYSLLVMVGYALIGWGPNQGARLTGIFLAVCGNNCALPAAMAFLANNVVGSSKRQFAVPIQTVFGGLGGIIGSLVFRSQDAPGYRPGLYASFACMALNILAAGGLGLYFRRQNKKADEEGKILEGLPGYRYTL